jgi:hypothetical protein
MTELDDGCLLMGSWKGQREGLDRGKAADMEGIEGRVAREGQRPWS